MATPTKEVLEGKLRELGWNPPAEATSAELQKLLKQAKDLPAALSVPERPEPVVTAPPPAAARTTGTAPPLRPPAPLARPTTAHVAPHVPAQALAVPGLPPLPVPAVPAPPRSEHEQRPHDPFAGW